MILDSNTLDYLNGKKFSNGLSVPYSFSGPIPKRVDFLKELVREKQVLHLGCLDHLPLIDNKISSGQWLHKRFSIYC